MPEPEVRHIIPISECWKKPKLPEGHRQLVETYRVREVRAYQVVHRTVDKDVVMSTHLKEPEAENEARRLTFSQQKPA